MLTAEKLHLLLTRPNGRSEAPSLHRTALAAGVLADLRATGVVSFSPGAPQRARIQVVAGGTTGHPVLDALLPAVDSLDGTAVADAVGHGRPDARATVVRHLTETGRLVERKAFLNTRHEPASDAERTALVARLTQVVRGEVEGTAEDTLLAGILHHLNVLRKVLPDAQGDRERRDAARETAALGRDDVLVQAVRDTVGVAAATAAAGAVVVG